MAIQLAGVPVISLHDYRSGDPSRRGQFIQGLGQGLKEYGFITLEHHQVDHDLIRKAYALFRDFFALPSETKMRYAKVEGGQRGYTVRAIHYPPLGPEADPRAVRAAAHEDINMITLLCEATSSGLELLTRQGEWLPVDALEGQIVVDAGDMLQRVTNHVIPSTTHRVVNPPGDANEPRYSMPYFVHPFSACNLEVLPRFVTPDEPARYEPITADAFLTERLREIGLLK